jgi:hypothetical protein
VQALQNVIVLQHMAPSIWRVNRGHVATAGALLFLLPCELLVFDVMGCIILFNTLWSLLFTFLYFTALIISFIRHPWPSQ